MQQQPQSFRQRFEAEKAFPSRTRRPIPLANLTASFATILTARSDADFLVQGLWVSDVSGVADSYRLCLVAPAGSATVANAVAWDVPSTAAQVDVVIGGQGLLVPPGYTLQARAATVSRLNMFGWGYDMTHMDEGDVI